MKEIQHNKFSIFRIEKRYIKGLKHIGEFGSTVTEKCFEYLETFVSLEEAQLRQKEYKSKTIILSSW